MEITKTVFESIRPRYPEFKGQVALVTGSSRGIGQGIALRLAREGMKIFLHGSDADELASSVEELKALEVDVQGIATNFSTEEGVNELFDFVSANANRLDLLVNNAADLRRIDFNQEHDELLDYQIAVNIRAPYRCSWQAASMMREGNGGNIINISSVGGLRAHWIGLPYDATKGAMDAMTRAMALDLAKHHIRVNAIAPGAIPTKNLNLKDLGMRYDAIRERIPLARLGTPLDIGASVAYLASEDASYITGQIIYVDGGITTQLSPPGQPI